MSKSNTLLPAVVIIGANSGIGLSLYRHYRHLGREVFAVGRGRNYRPSDFELDFEVELTTGEGLTELAIRLNGIRALVIVTSAILGPKGSRKLSPSAWIETLNVNVIGSLRVFDALTSSVSPSSKFVFFSGGGVGGNTHQQDTPAYVTSKAALVTMVEELSRVGEISDFATVAIAPGQFQTNFVNSQTDLPSKQNTFNSSTEGGEIPQDQLSKLIASLNFIEISQPEIISGRLISANWDNFDTFEQQVMSDPSSFGKLRRIDKDLFH